MADKLSRKISVERFDNLSLNKAMNTDDIIDLDSNEISEHMLPQSYDIIEQSKQQLMLVENGLKETGLSEMDYIKDNKYKNEFIIKETINKLYDQSIASGDPAFFGLLKQFLELSIKNDESLMKILDKMNGGSAKENNNITGNESVNIQNNYYEEKPRVAVGSPMQLLQEYGEAVDKDGLSDEEEINGV